MSDSESREETLLKALRNMQADKRQSFLAEACAAESDLRKRIEERLMAEGEPDVTNEPDRQPSNETMRIERVEAFERAGSSIGPYKLLEQIGEGGCGVVYRAEQVEPVHRRVALKLIKPGMDTRQVLARFEAERQALALMDHPNIAKVFEAGSTTTGRPFFVMELVKGIRITDYCDEKKLDTRRRLDLFVQVCQAIQHAHQKGIIHRDIKPSNILVSEHDGVPVPKIIDFGIAKATTDQPLTNKTLFTALEQFIGTPAYMSPEQAKLSGLDVDTRSDIYSLGVLLYELLTGKTPFDSHRLMDAGLDEIRRIIREEDPPRPSTKLSTLNSDEQTTIAHQRQSQPPKLVGLLRGDLDWIVMKCLEKDRTRRYETANGLAMDLKRHLSDEAVMARPPNSAYRFKKALSRHRFLFLATGAVGVTLLLGICVSGWQAIRARRAEAKKDQALRESEHQRRQALENEDRALGLLYASDMQDVQKAIEGGRLERARDLLKVHLPKPGQSDRRGFEWYYYSHVAKGEQTAVLLEQSKPFIGMAVAQDGKMVVLLDEEEVQAFDLIRRKVVQRWPFVARGVRRMSISPSGGEVAFGTTNGFELLSTTSGQTTAMGTGRCDVISFAADQPWIATSRLLPRVEDPAPVQIWDYKHRRLLHVFPKGGGAVLWWETNSTVLAGINYDGTLQRWDAITGIQIQEIVADPRRKDKFRLSGAVTPRGTRGVVSEGTDLTIFDPADGRVLQESPWPMGPFALSAAGRLIASGEDATIRLAETANLQKYKRLAGHLEDVSGVRFIGATSNLLSCGKDGRLLLWEPRAESIISFVPNTNPSSLWLNDPIFVSADQRHCGVFGKLWSLPSGELVRDLRGIFLGFSPTGAEYATAENNQLQVWKCADSGKNPASVSPLPLSVTNIFSLTLSSDGLYGVYVARDMNVFVFEAQSGKVLANAAEQALPNSDKTFLQAEFLPNSHRLILFMDPGTAIWDWQATNGVWKLASGLFLAASSDGRRIAVRDESGRRLKLFETEANSKSQIVLEGHNDLIISVAFSHDGRTLASLGSRDGIRLWKLPEGQLMGVIPANVSLISAMAFSTDDQGLYIRGQLGVVILDAPKPEQTVTLPSISKPRAVTMPHGSVWNR